jgi:hypothetical protein
MWSVIFIQPILWEFFRWKLKKKMKFNRNILSRVIGNVCVYSARSKKKNLSGTGVLFIYEQNVRLAFQSTQYHAENLYSFCIWLILYWTHSVFQFHIQMSLHTAYATKHQFCSNAIVNQISQSRTTFSATWMASLCLRLNKCHLWHHTRSGVTKRVIRF